MVDFGMNTTNPKYLYTSYLILDSKFDLLSLVVTVELQRHFLRNSLKYIQSHLITRIKRIKNLQAIRSSHGLKNSIFAAL